MSFEEKRLNIRDAFSEKSVSEEDASHFFLAREIVQEIKKFGVSQITLTKVIELLALELENRARMLEVIRAVKGEIQTSGSPIINE